ncbi:hypothetical protein [Amycolatopsis sp. SID8362]|uniref:hypothetical protein n=1 Tax=Amycolatopsis sp. SID8362 TaxID=2690346 RepID=UPI00136AB97E|nr:hypothetical protein [Amycolatopsis sp. SID8362]NBH02012.1 hypothetical protein [Amycolatopsis sp. SID8362]NED38715.1 hypothetical protein [Amycolatopsis sp. SID8362]
MDTREEPAITDEELAGYAKGKFLLRVLGLRTMYYQLLRDYNGRDALWAAAVVRRLVPDDPDLPGRIRDSVLRVGGYQIWSDVQGSEKVLNRAFDFQTFAVVAFSVGAVLPNVDGSISERLATAGIAAVTGYFVSLLGLAVSGARRPVSPIARTVLGLLGLGALMVAGWWLLRWPSSWGPGLASGFFVAVATLFLLDLLYQAGYELILGTYRVCWTRFTAAEIVESLAETHWLLVNAPEPESLRTASFTLEHVASCVERFLPRYLSATLSPISRSTLPRRVHPEFAEMAAGTRLLAKDCLLPKATTRTEVADKVARLLVTAARERWGEWDRADAEELERATRWRLWLSGALRLGLGLLPLVLVALGAFYVYKTNPTSPLLKAEVLAPVLVAALGFFATVLNPGSEREKAGRRRKPFGGRKIGT